jgi:RNA polymerase sigma-70 factor (ECF subfamily)
MDERYDQVTAEFGAPLARLARSYEADAEKRRDLLQEIHFAIWRSLRAFRGQCSLRTWVYRVAHNVAATHVLRSRRARPLVGLDEVEEISAATDTEKSVDRQRTLERLYALIEQLRPLDREVILLYLEDLDGAAIAEITGISPANVATKIHRIKKLLARRFHE